MSKDYYDTCLKEAAEAFETLNAHGGYVRDDDHIGAMVSQSLSAVLAALTSYTNVLQHAKTLEGGRHER